MPLLVDARCARVRAARRRHGALIDFQWRDIIAQLAAGLDSRRHRQRRRSAMPTLHGRGRRRALHLAARSMAMCAIIGRNDAAASPVAGHVAE